MIQSPNNTCLGRQGLNKRRPVKAAPVSLLCIGCIVSEILILVAPWRESHHTEPLQNCSNKLEGNLLLGLHCEQEPKCLTLDWN